MLMARTLTAADAARAATPTGLAVWGIKLARCEISRIEGLSLKPPLNNLIEIHELRAPMN